MIAKYIGKTNKKFNHGNLYAIDSKFSIDAFIVDGDTVYQPIIMVYHNNEKLIYKSPEEYSNNWIINNNILDTSNNKECDNITLKEFIRKYISYNANICLCVPLSGESYGRFRIIKSITNETYGNCENILRGIGWQSKYANSKFISVISLCNPYNNSRLGIVNIVIDPSDVEKVERYMYE